MTHHASPNLPSVFARARELARPLSSVPPLWRPQDLQDAWRMQHASWGYQDIVGWKVSGLTEAQRLAMGIEQPISAPLLAAWVRDRYDTDEFIFPLIESEIAVELGHDLPVRQDPYTREEVAHAIASVRPAIEVVDSRLPRGSGTLLELADDFNNGGFFAGPPVRDWRGIDFATCNATLHLTRGGERKLVATGSGKAVLDGDILGAVVAMANTQCPLYGGLKAGHIVTTGTCTGAVPLSGATFAEAHFDRLGSVAVQFAPMRRRMS
jgi:2-keto-4-pentenoate hydratase